LPGEGALSLSSIKKTTGTRSISTPSTSFMGNGKNSGFQKRRVKKDHCGCSWRKRGSVITFARDPSGGLRTIWRENEATSSTATILGNFGAVDTKNRNAMLEGGRTFQKGSFPRAFEEKVARTTRKWFRCQILVSGDCAPKKG